ncbi:RNA 3'-terminal phosphate cyclase [candidate division KSB3 bacterium]|uniref:RNA 3'-terminal phosphate cyclase n=1 Tax=candidate division KSB3 bacterium TaxID=2044937 RepID=A0A9D5JS82_9BACT|nr:RNA 3'-terminal phosphate cyclase [candidate division KSB3 bacterium]MBD3323313.1 RNA 3'-terminal phosphate cyclase [candidate division KSB3 bacterium]
MICIDGAFGEGGGQILRTSLALSLVTGNPFRIEHIRANRKKPGLRRQHLTAVDAAAHIGCAEVRGNTLDSQTLEFTPNAVNAGNYHFAVGTAGSCTLVLQTVLPALLTAEGRSHLVLEGGTHNPHAPTFEVLDLAFVPLLRRMGAGITAVLERPGFYPAGSGKCAVTIEPTGNLSRFDLLERGKIKRQEATAVVSKLPSHIAERELAVIQRELGWDRRHLHVQEVQNPRGPGNVLTCILESAHMTEVFTGFGERGVSAETVARRTVAEIREYLEADVPIGKHLADQILLPLALAGEGSFRTLAPTQHTVTNIAMIKKFLDLDIAVNQCDAKCWEIRIGNENRS